MPRGGGGGFRGGGGGGFRGGGFRGGGRSFRVGNVRRSGRPFGRTGARRTVSRPPRGHHFHRHRPYHRRWWGGYWRPWWRRPWHWYGFWGRPWRPWYYAPVYWGGGLVLAILLLLLFIPLLGLAFIPFPFTNSSSTGIITYSDTQMLYYNEYWFEWEYLPTGRSITYDMEAQTEVTFIIWDQPFDEFFGQPVTISGNYSESMTVEGNHDYEFIGYFLRKGSSLTVEYNITSGGSIEFFIADSNDFNRWNNWETITPLFSNSGPYDFSMDIPTSIPYTQDWYLVWYNEGDSPVGIDFNVEYVAVDMPNFSVAADPEGVVLENVLEAEGTFITPNDGDWYFFIYLDPFYNPNTWVDITFNIRYDTGITHDDQWNDFTPILLFFIFIIFMILIIAIIQRHSTRGITAETAATAAAAAEPSTTETTKPVTPVTGKKCHRCNVPSQPGDVYCANCGAKLSGRDYGVSTITTPATSKKCLSCNNPITSGSRFCKYCGAKIEHEAKIVEFTPGKGKPFFCQLDNAQHPSTDSAYQCDQCSRKICGTCYDEISHTGVTVCPYCKGNLQRVQ